MSGSIEELEAELEMAELKWTNLEGFYHKSLKLRKSISGDFGKRGAGCFAESGQVLLWR